MKLVLLNSKKETCHSKIIEKIKDLVNSVNPSIGYMTSRLDRSGYYYQQTKANYEKYDLKLGQAIDLTDEYDAHWIHTLFACDAIHLTDGNAFQFMYWIKKRNLELQLIDYCNTGGLLIGEGAGAILFTPTLTISTLCGHKNNFNLDNTKGFGFTNFHFLPCEINKHDILKGTNWAKHHHCTTVLGGSNDAMIVDDNNITYIGNPTIIPGAKIVQEERRRTIHKWLYFTRK